MSLKKAICITFIGLILEIIIINNWENPLCCIGVPLILLFSFLIWFFIKMPETALLLLLIVIVCICPPLGIMIFVLLKTKAN